MMELWADIDGYEGQYRVSNTGNVLSLERSFIKSNGRRAYFPERILIQYKRGSGKKKYAAVKLCNNGIEKTKSVHILVAKAFVDGYFDGAQVNHDDGDKWNNNAWNLSWTDNSGNQKHAYKLGLNKVSTRSIQKLIERCSGKNSHKAIPLIDTVTGQKYDTVRQAAQAVGINENKLYAWVTGRNTNKSTLIINNNTLCPTK
jgi:NUMOD4 motif-containing protein